MLKDYLDFLISPDDSSLLKFDDINKNHLVSNSDNYVYPIKENVPLLLKENAIKQFSLTNQHNKMNSKFFYVDHYKVDAEEFDYFEEFTNGATLHEIYRLHQTIASEIPKNVKNILDVGCGNAWVAKNFCPKGVAVCSFDISPVNTSKALVKYPFDNHFAVVGDAYHLPFRPNSFDCIIASEIIEHVPNPEKFIESLLGVLKPGGSLIITTPYNEQINYYLCIHCNCPTPQHAHIHSFTKKKMLAISPIDKVKSYKIYTFGNKALIMLRTHMILKYVHQKIWKIIDKLASKIIKKPTRILFKIEK